ncbi:unnamed protein product [Lymnaea stagnalis]|uniref:VWFA domain-containing protein n=1 Tax=Lymnaea stagnalis TaxID=6523 RepID=A0AAV2HDF2_LYMST
MPRLFKKTQEMMGRSVDNDMRVPKEISALQEELLKTALPVDVTIRGVKQTETEQIYSEQLLIFHGNITEDLNIDFDQVLNHKQDEKIHIILVVDKSGSMSGNPFNQVKNALEEIVSQCLNDPYKVIDIILYAEKAETISFTPSNYKETISNLKADGSTNFKAAFDEADASIGKRRNDGFGSTVILFMTDGVDTVSNQSKANEYAKKWAKSLKSLTHQVTVHAVGFSTDHDLHFLTKISNAGSVQGLYRYCEPADGPEALREKLEELFDYVSISGGKPIKIEVNLMNPKDSLINLGGHSGTIEGCISFIEQEDSTSELIAAGECWVCINDSNILPQISLGILLVVTKNKIKFTLQIPCQVRKMNYDVITDVGQLALWELSIMSRNSDILTTEFVAAITAGNDVVKLKSNLDDLQSKISSVAIFKAGYNKDTRAKIMDHIREIQGKVNKLYAMLAQYIRGETQSVSLLARAHDLKYEVQFSKSRRQRLMDRRAANNFNKIKSDSQKAIVGTEAALGQLSEDALGFYHCILSMSNVKDILLDCNDLENAMGIGLAVTRPEFALDDPTSIRIHSISGNLVSRSSVMDALEFKINLDSHLSAHGGFSFCSGFELELPFATFGASREPINAWLPLYICPAHWERVKSSLRPALGYLCTLDPLGYSENQLNVMFMTLGCMIGQLFESQAGENQLKLILAFQRTCQALMEDFNLTQKIKEIVSNFLQSPMGRFRNEIPNLYTLIGYIASLPVLVSRDLLGYTDGDRTYNLNNSKLWTAFLTEILRRASGFTSELHGNDNVVTSLHNLILHGQQTPNGHTVEYQTSDENTILQLGKLCSLQYGEADKLVIPVYDPSTGAAAPDVRVNHSAKVDKAMELWAQAKCGFVKNKNRSEKVAEAKKVVKKWVDLVKERTGLPIKSTTDVQKGNISLGKVVEVPSCQAGLTQKETRLSTHFDTTAVNSSILSVIAKLLHQIGQHCYPHISHIPGFFGFLQYWVTHDHTQEEIATNGGLPPDHWIQGVKSSMSDFVSKIKAFQQRCEDAGSIEETGTTNSAEENNDDPGRPRGEGYLPMKDEQEQFSEAESQSNSRKHQTQQIFTIPSLMSALAIPGNHIELLRAMLCQAVSYSSNSQAREATLSGELLDLTCTGNSYNYLCQIKANLDERKEAVIKKMIEKAAWEIGNLSMLKAETLWAFIGYLLITHKERGEGFSQLINFILECPGVLGFPLLAEKIQILLLGKYQGCVVFAKGNTFLPDKKLSSCLEKVLGEEVWCNIERELLSNVHIHVYRESDKPNRQGHCNSNPYVPNRIRQILGMPLIDEKIQPRTSVKRHRSLQNK